MEPRARVSVWPGRRRVPGIVAPDSWGARGAECLPRDVLRRSSPATSPCDGTTARRCLCHGTGPAPRKHAPPQAVYPRRLMGVWGSYRATWPIPGRIFGAGIGKDARFWKLAQSLSALYPPGIDEKRWVDGVLVRKESLGL